MKNKYLLLFLSVILVSFTSQSNRTIESKEKSKYVILQENGKTKIDALFLYSSVFKGIKTIVLETNESCLIGFIKKIHVFENNIFVLDAVNAKSLYIFDKEGHFVRKIGGIGQGPGDYTRPNDFTIDKAKKTIYILDAALQRINKYDIATGNFISAINLDKGVISDRIEFMDGKIYTDASFQNHSDKNYLLRVIQESSGKDVGQYLNVMDYHKGISNNLRTTIQPQTFFLRKNGNLVFVQQFMDHLIEINRDSVFSLIDLKGKESITPAEIKRAYEKNELLYRTELRKLNKYFEVHSFVENDNWFLLEYCKGVWPKTILIDKKTNEVTIFEKNRDDLLLSENAGNSYPVPQAGCFDEHGVYFFIHQVIIPNIKKWVNGGVFSPNLDRLEELKKIDEHANPILFYYEFKE